MSEYLERLAFHVNRQMVQGTVCLDCGFTQIQHTFNREQTCKHYKGPEDTWSSEPDYVSGIGTVKMEWTEN